MYRVSIELYQHEWKFGRTRNAVGTQAAGECFHSLLGRRSLGSSRNIPPPRMSAEANGLFN